MTHEYVLGIDLGGTDCKFGIVDENGRIIHSSKNPTRAELGPEAVIDGIASHARNLLAVHPDVRGVGMGVPGPMSSRLGMVFETPNLPGWNNIPVQRMLEERLRLPVVLNNDANAAAYGEYWGGVGRDIEGTMILFTLGTGVGGGIVLNGDLYVGPDDTAGELGHMIINFDGPQCGCGARGCLEAYASATAVRREVREALAAGVQTSINIPEGSEDDFGAKVVYDAAVAGDAFAIDLFRRMGVALGCAAATMINAINPDLLVYGGAISNAGEFIFGPLRETAQANAFAKPFSRVKIVKAELGNDAGIIGAAGLALHAGRNKPQFVPVPEQS